MSGTREGAFSVRTPEGIVFELVLAGPVTRCLAWLVDVLCVGFLLSVAATVIGLAAKIHADLARALMILSFFVLQIGYGVTLEWIWRGQTLGKRFLGLRVVDAQGLQLQFSQVLLRNLVRFVDVLPGLYGVGGAACLLTRRAQRLGDLAANTIVVRSPRRPEPDAGQFAGGKYNSLKAYPHLVARLRTRVAPAELRLALQALGRRDQLDAEPRVTVFADLAGHFRSMVGFPPEAQDGVTDEQYVRNVVEVLCRGDRPRTENPAARGRPSAG